MSNINLPNIPGKFLLRFGNSRPEAGTTRYKKPNFFTDDTFYDNQRMEHGIPSSENTDYEYESGAFFCFTVEGNTGEARTGTLEYTATTAPDEDYEGVFNVTCAWTVVQEGHYVPPTPTATWQAYNSSLEWNVYGNLHTGSTQDYAGLELHTGETEDHSEAVPVTLTSAYLALSPAPQNPENYSIVLSNSTYGDAMICTFNSVGSTNNAWVGTGSVRLQQGTVLNIAVVQENSRGTVQEEPEPDETEDKPEER